MQIIIVRAKQFKLNQYNDIYANHLSYENMKNHFYIEFGVRPF